MVKQQILEDLNKVVKGLGYKDTDTLLSISKNPQFGDYSTNLALQLAKLKSSNDKQSPDEIAKEILEKFGNPEYLEKAEVAGGGFINFFITPKSLEDYLNKICKDFSLINDESKINDNKKIMIEYTDPNPFKQFHIGHLLSNSIGESLSRILEATGAEVKRVNYFGDVGMHVAKSIWGMKKKLKEEGLNIAQLEEKSLADRIQFLAQAYTIGIQVYEEDKVVQEEIKKINLLVYIAAKAYVKKADDQIDSNELKEITELFEKGKKWSLEYLETIYAKLGTKFDYYYPESLVAEHGKQLVEQHLKDGVFKKSEGAIIFPGEKFGLHRRVFINSLGLPTYEAKELGLAVKKYQDYPYDLSIIVTGNEIKEYFQVLLEALKQTKPDLARKTINIAHGMVRITEGKMSSRKGNVITFEGLFNEVSKMISQVMKDSQIPEEEKERVTEIVSIGAIKFSLLKSSPHMDVTFDLEKSISLNGDSGPYLQYTYARARSVLKNGKYEPKEIEIEGELETEERELLIKIDYFSSVIKDAGQNLHPSTIASFLLDFSKVFNLFYQKHPIIKAGEKTGFRLALTFGVAEVLKRGLSLLGIEAPERM